MIFLLDNYDSFTYNIYQYLTELGEDVFVARNDKITIKEVVKLNPDKIVISPGPSNPDHSGISNELISYFADKNIPILGVCLGHQCIGQVFGALIESAGEIKHGKTSLIHHDGKGIYAGLPNPFEAVRYHSLAINPEKLSPLIEITARTENGIIMGVRHKKYPIEGIQFHPESIMTPYGKNLLMNFIKS
jgi:para-aminobenzoate synthetase component 2|tara:strand:- start:234 stop:800 length:567 start_codon:yes stop_codon:yes gene_type:complete